MKKIILFVLITFLLISIATAIEPEGKINTNPQNPPFSFIEFFKSLFLKPLAVLPSTYTCSSSVSISKTFQAKATDISIGSVCADTAKIKLFKCNSNSQNLDCLYNSYVGEDYKVNGINPSFGGFIINNYYQYLCYNCVQQQTCTEGKVSGTRTCDGGNVYYQYQNADCSKTNKFIATCSQGLVCNTNQLDSIDCIQGTTEQQCTDTDGGRNYEVRGIVKSGGGSATDNCIDTTRLNEWYCSGLFSKSPSLEVKDCSTIGGFCKDGVCVKQQTCADFGLQECSTFGSQWVNLQCSSDSRNIIGQRCTDIGLKTPCYQKGFLTKEQCGTNQICENAQCKTQTTCLWNNQQYKVGDTIANICDSFNEEVRIEQVVTAIGSNGFCQVESKKFQCGQQFFKQKICEAGTCVLPPEPPTQDTCQFGGKTYKIGDSICLEGKTCDSQGFYCDQYNKIQRKQIKVTNIKNGVCGTETLTTQCGKSGLPLQQETCNEETAKCEKPSTPPEGCSSCGAGFTNVCDVAECHNLKCVVSEQDKGFGINKEDNIISSNNCVSKILIGKQCDISTKEGKTKDINSISSSCISNYCKKKILEKNFFEKLINPFESKVSYTCSDKPKGYCGLFTWAERLPLVDGDNSCSAGTFLILLIVAIAGFLIYNNMRKRGKFKGKKKPLRRRR